MLIIILYLLKPTVCRSIILMLHVYELATLLLCLENLSSWTFRRDLIGRNKQASEKNKCSKSGVFAT